jgi:hypothetical protein
MLDGGLRVDRIGWCLFLHFMILACPMDSATEVKFPTGECTRYPKAKDGVGRVNKYKNGF